MDDTTSNEKTTVAATQPAATGSGGQAYGTAKTENLRDNGLWRILLPGFVLVGSVALLAFPLIILTPLFLRSLDPKSAANVLNKPETWIWIVMFLVELGIIAVIVRGLAKVFLVQNGNYRR